MAQYQVLARKYRPQTFGEVLNQEAIVTTLKNAIKNNCLAQAYIFCGSRGTGKTTLARILAKALNCQNPTGDCEPCNQCTSCKEITAGHSLDVLEIDGASNRGIDDVRQINETVGYAASAGGYKIYIIDEVHMLTKEAFNALLKTLEEPPPKVKFLFATTEAHKVLPTILSRCQRFNLKRISTEQIQSKLRKISQDLNIVVEDEALRLIAECADGGLRDAESLFDQILAFHKGTISSSVVAAMLGIVERDFFFLLDKAGQEGNLAAAFEMSETVLSHGKDIIHFVENLTKHFRDILVVKVSGKQAPFLNLSEKDLNQYEASAKLYSQETCLTILDFLVEAQNQIKFATSPKTMLEALLLRVIRSQSRIPIDILVRRLADLEQKSIKETPEFSAPQPQVPPSLSHVEPMQINVPQKQETATILDKNYEEPQNETTELKNLKEMTRVSTKITKEKVLGMVNIDPTPSNADLGITITTAAKPILTNIEPSKQSRYDTILQFAAIELEGIIEKK